MTYQDVETARQDYLAKVKKQTLIATIAILGLLIITIIFSGATIQEATLVLIVWTFFTFITVLTIISLLNRKLRANYHKAYKEYFIERNLRAVFSNLEYSHELGLPSSFLYNTGMINTGDRYFSNDYVRARFKNVAFCQADVRIEVEDTDSDGDTHYYTIFKGRFMVFEFPKEFNFKLALVGKKFAAFKKSGRDKKTGRKLEKFATESPTFNKLIKAYAEDGFEAFYLLDPKAIATIEDITTRYDGRVALFFCNNQLIIGLNNGKDSFEPPRPFRPIDEAKEDAKVASEIKIITDFVDSLSLNRKIFK